MMKTATGFFKTGLAALVLVPLLATPAFASPPVKEYPDLNYVSVVHALIRLGKLKPENKEYLEAYTFAAHCDVAKGSYRDEFRWRQALDAVKTYLEQRKKGFPTTLTVRSQVMFDRYDFPSKTFLFAPETAIKDLNVFPTEPRPNDPECAKDNLLLLPQRYRVVTNNPLSLPGLRLTEDQAKDLAQKFNLQDNPHRIAYIRFNIDILDSDYMGPSVFTSQTHANDPTWLVKATLRSVEFFSDPAYQNRFFYYVPL